MAHANADAGAGATTPSACLQHPQRRRRSATRGAYPKCAQACDAHVKCGGARVPAARRVERASKRRLSDVAAQWQRRSTRALTMFSAGNRRRRARGAVSRACRGGVSLLAADLGAAFGAMASVLPAGGARTRAASALGLHAARCARPSYEYANFDFDFGRKTARN